MNEILYDPLDDDELALLDGFLLNRLSDETADKIAAEGGDEGILGVSELDGFLTALISGPNVIVPSRWLPVMWGAEEPIWDSASDFQEIFGLIMRHQNSIAMTLLHDPQSFEPMFEESEVDGEAHIVVDEWCWGYMRGVQLDAEAWRAAQADIGELLRPIWLWGTEDGWKSADAMSAADQQRERDAIPLSVRALHKYWLERRTPLSVSVRRAGPKVGRNDPCPCGSGKKYKHCCLH